MGRPYTIKNDFAYVTLAKLYFIIRNFENADNFPVERMIQKQVLLMQKQPPEVFLQKVFLKFSQNSRWCQKSS